MREQEERPSHRVENDRESIWTIPTRLKRWYFALFSIQAVAATAWIIRTAIVDERVSGASEVLLFLWQYLAPAAVASATFALVIVDAANGNMVLSTWLQETLEKRRQREQERHRREVQAAAQAAADKASDEARETERQKWLEWNQRRVEAEAAGEDFNEPPPGTSKSSEKTT